MELDETPDSLSRSEPDVAALRELYTRFELRSLLKQLDEAAPGGAGEAAASAEPRPGNYEIVLDETALDRWLGKLDSAELVAFDTETTSLNYMEAELVGVSLAVEAGEAAYIPVAHDYPGAPDQLDRDLLLTKLRPFLENARTTEGRPSPQV